MNRSNGTQVLLRRLDLGLAGNFSCEVTAESPSFATQIATKFIDVIALPVSDPTLHADKDRYQPGETLRANCSSAPARPAANLTIYVNDDPQRSSETSLHSSGNGLFTTRVTVELVVTPGLFPGGRLRLECAATIFDVYARTAKLDFFTPDTDPRPERITLNGGAPTYYRNLFLLFLLLFLPTVFCQDYGEYESVFDGSALGVVLSKVYNTFHEVPTRITPFKPKVLGKTCLLKPDTGPCRGDIAMYYFKPETMKCERFSWGGCQGNGNRFDTENECMETCLSQPSKPSVRPKWCHLAFDYGFCFGAVKRWYYDKQWNVCKETIYSGCGGNKNNFYNSEQCDSICRFNKGAIKESADISGNLKKVLIINPLQASQPGALTIPTKPNK
ncbi:unnamed protein product, partial [Iphiclides podalirius]